MSTITLYWSEILYATSALMMGAAGISICRFEKTGRRFVEFWMSPAGNALNEQVQSQKLLHELDERIALLSEIVDSLTSPDSGTGDRPDPVFRKAMVMARRGASSDELSRICGLSRSEAALLMKVHRPDGRPENLN